MYMCKREFIPASERSEKYGRFTGFFSLCVTERERGSLSVYKKGEEEKKLAH